MNWAERVATRLGIDLSSGQSGPGRVTSTDQVKSILLKAIEEAVSVYGDFETPLERQQLTPVALRGESLDLAVLRAAGGIRSGSRLFFSLGALTYSFEASILRQSDSHVFIEIPPTLDFGEQRHATRWRISATGGDQPRLRRRGGVATHHSYPLRDLSRSGLSAVVSGRKQIFSPGQRVTDLEVRFHGETIALPPVEVRNVTALDNGTGWRIGVELGLDRRPIRVRDLDFPLAASSRARRRRKVPGEDGESRRVRIVRYQNARGERIVGILDSTFGERAAEPVPVVILPPATGRRKETLSALALTIVENFRERGKHVAVLRFDGVRRHGESANDPEGRKPGMEMIHSTMGQAISDIHATLDFLYDNPAFRPARVAVISMSSASIEVRRTVVEDGGKRIHYWISLAGSPDFHDTLKNICGGLDLLGSHRNGVTLGVTPVLGNPVDLERFFKDAFDRRLVYLQDSLEEIPRARVPITWIYGRYDDWVRPERVKKLMSVRSEMPREVFSIPTGHQMRTSGEAMEGFKLVTACLWKFFQGSAIRPFAPDPAALVEIRDAEKSRLAKQRNGDHRNFWRDYLERKDRYLGFDIIRETEAYRDLMARQIDLLNLAGGERILDAGCGTGNFIEALLDGVRLPDDSRPLPREVTLADYVPEALETARRKFRRLSREARVALPKLHFRTVDLECSRFLPFAQALDGGGFRWDALRGGVEGLSGKLLDRFAREGGAPAIRMARGEDPTGESAGALAGAFGKEGVKILADLGRAARFLRGTLVAEDLKDPGSVDLGNRAAYGKLTAGSLRWKRLAFGNAGRSSRLPFQADAFDRIVSSLVICYLYRPQGTIAEFHRLLAPGGVLVLSSMKPDADISRIYMRLIERLRSSEEIEIPRGLTREDLLNSARTFLNKAADILNLEEDGAFEFLPKEDLVAMLRSAGFRNIRVVGSFGDPPQAFVLSGRKT